MVPALSPAGSRRLGFLPALGANLVPLLGVLQFGWDADTLVTVYALELVLTLPLAAAKALFAQQPPRVDEERGILTVSADLARKRGSLELVSWAPPVYPRTVPFVTRVLNGATYTLVVVALVLNQAVSVGRLLTRPEVIVSVGVLLATQLGDIARNYIGNGEYRERSPYTVLETPMRQAFFLLVLLLVLPDDADALAVLVALVVGKLLVEWSAYRVTDGGLSGWLAGPDETANRPEPPQIPEGDPDARFPTDRAAVVWTALFRTLPPLARQFTRARGWWSGRSHSVLSAVRARALGSFSVSHSSWSCCSSASVRRARSGTSSNAVPSSTGATATDSSPTTPGSTSHSGPPTLTCSGTSRCSTGGSPTDCPTRGQSP